MVAGKLSIVAQLAEAARTKLEAMLDRHVREFSFPFGAFNERLMEFCREAGYERAYTTLPALAVKRPNEFVVGRVRVDPTDWPLEFRLKLAGAYRWLPMMFSLKRKIFSTASLSMEKATVDHQHRAPLCVSRLEYATRGITAIRGILSGKCNCELSSREFEKCL